MKMKDYLYEMGELRDENKILRTIINGLQRKYLAKEEELSKMKLELNKMIVEKNAILDRAFQLQRELRH